jgi:hypothetical protein
MDESAAVDCRFKALTHRPVDLRRGGEEAQAAVAAKRQRVLVVVRVGCVIIRLDDRFASLSVIDAATCQEVRDFVAKEDDFLVQARSSNARLDPGNMRWRSPMLLPMSTSPSCHME